MELQALAQNSFERNSKKKRKQKVPCSQSIIRLFVLKTKPHTQKHVKNAENNFDMKSFYQKNLNSNYGIKNYCIFRDNKKNMLKIPKTKFDFIIFNGEFPS